MKAITIRPPWIHAITEPGASTILSPSPWPKRCENRSRACAHRGLVGLHAGVAWDKGGLRDGRVQRHLLGRYVDGGAAGFLALGLPVGAVLAVADLVDCHAAAPLDTAEFTCCFPWGEPGQWHLVLDNVRVLDQPVPAKGKSGVLWTLPDDVAAEVAEQIGVAP